MGQSAGGGPACWWNGPVTSAPNTRDQCTSTKHQGPVHQHQTPGTSDTMRSLINTGNPLPPPLLHSSPQGSPLQGALFREQPEGGCCETRGCDRHLPATPQELP